MNVEKFDNEKAETLSFEGRLDQEIEQEMGEPGISALVKKYDDLITSCNAIVLQRGIGFMYDKNFPSLESHPDFNRLTNEKNEIVTKNGDSVQTFLVKKSLNYEAEHLFWDQTARYGDLINNPDIVEKVLSRLNEGEFNVLLSIVQEKLATVLGTLLYKKHRTEADPEDWLFPPNLEQKDIDQYEQYGACLAVLLPRLEGETKSMNEELLREIQSLMDWLERSKIRLAPLRAKKQAENKARVDGYMAEFVSKRKI